MCAASRPDSGRKCNRPSERRARAGSSAVFAVASVAMIVAIAAAGTGGADAHVAPRAAQALRATEVIFYVPSMPAGTPQDGSCWTGSIAAPRPGAWRCSVGNAIHDPCFQVPPHRDELVCGADPALGKNGFPLKLTKPLPASGALASAIGQPWIMQLADNSICEAMTGTLPSVGGNPARWSCFLPPPRVGEHPKTVGYVTEVRRAKIWTVLRYTPEMIGAPPDASRRIRAQTVIVRKVWE
jgi:hypothetical protein